MAVRRIFTPELIANGRRRYEETDEPVPSIAVDFKVAPRTLNKYVRLWGWKPRSERPPLDLSPALRALAEAQAAERAVPRPAVMEAAAAALPTTKPSLPCAEAPDRADAERPPAEDAPPPGEGEAAPSVDVAALVERLRRAVELELTAVENMRARLGPQPQEPVEAERTARTLATLARTLKEIERLRLGASAEKAPAPADDEYVPEDIDEFRLALARKIDALLASRSHDGDAESADVEGTAGS